MKKDSNARVSGELLIADFQSALAARATADLAQSEARRTEDAVVSELHALSSQAYLNPGSISPVRQNDIGMASLNAHVMKVQAAQLQHLSHEQLTNLQAQVSANYIGRKVRVRSLTAESPFDTIWLNKQTGYRSSVYKKSTLTGSIAEVDLTKNLLVLKPKLLPRLINSEFNAYFVYVIDPSTLQPAVEIQFV